MLQFQVIERRQAQLANNAVVAYEVVSSVELRFKNRQTTRWAIVLPGDSVPFLCAILLEDVDVLLHPTKVEMIVNPEHLFIA